jgi:hypothetical protein
MSEKSQKNEGPQLRINQDINMSSVLEEIESKSAVSKPHDDNAKREYSPVVSQSMASQRYEEKKVATYNQSSKGEGSSKS